ncbi:MAG: hypothetical protein ABIS47_09145 [Acidimicrobiales bacterium]
MAEGTEASTPWRQNRVRRARLLAWFTIGWNCIEGVVGIASGVAAGSIALVGFGVDSYVEVLSGAVVLWRPAKERHGEELSEAAEHRALRIIDGTFFAWPPGSASNPSASWPPASIRPPAPSGWPSPRCRWSSCRCWRGPRPGR